METLLASYRDLVRSALPTPQNGYLSVVPSRAHCLSVFRREVETFLTGGTGEFLPDRVIRLQQQGFDLEDDPCPEMGSVVWFVNTPRGRVLFR